MLRHQLLLLVAENFHDQRGDRQEQPLKEQPPPTDEEPPKNSVVFIFKFHVGHDLGSYIGGSAFRTSHNNYLLFVLLFILRRRKMQRQGRSGRFYILSEYRSNRDFFPDHGEEIRFSDYLDVPGTVFV